MCENETISYKVYLKYPESPDDLEVRRFAIDKEEKPTFNNLLSKLFVVFPRLQHEDFTVNWHDNANNFVTINSDDDLAMALSIMVGPLFKLKIVVKAKWNQDMPAQQQQQQIQKQQQEQQQQQCQHQHNDHHKPTHTLLPPPLPSIIQGQYPFQFPDAASFPSWNASVASQAAANIFAAAATNARAAASMAISLQGNPMFYSFYSQLGWPQQMGLSHQTPLLHGSPYSHLLQPQNNNLYRFAADTIAVGNVNIGTHSTPGLVHPKASVPNGKDGPRGMGQCAQWPAGYRMTDVTQNLSSINLE